MFTTSSPGIKIISMSIVSFMLLLSFPYATGAVVHNQSASYLDISCEPAYENDDNGYLFNSPGRANLSSILSSLATHAANSLNYTTVENYTALAFCWADVDVESCRSCLAIASHEFLRRCPKYSWTGKILYDVCSFGYKFGFSIYSDVLGYSYHFETSNLLDQKEIGFMEKFVPVLIDEAGKSSLMFASKTFSVTDAEKRYASAQCRTDTGVPECLACLNRIKHEIIVYSEGEGRNWWRMNENCTIRYGDSPFYMAELSVPGRNQRGHTKSTILVIAIVCGLVVVTLLTFPIYNIQKRNKTARDRPRENILVAFNDQVQDEGSLVNVDHLMIPFITIEHSTNHFSEQCKLGKGGFGTVYKGTLQDGRQIAVKRLSKASNHGLEEFKNEVISIAHLQHRNIVKLFGCCLEKNEKLIVYEYMPNGSLDSHIFGKEKQRQLDWDVRMNIITGIAKGLLYIHEGSTLRIIHRDLKAGNILLDQDMTPKISDFGLARIFRDQDQRQVDTRRIAGTYGYIAPEYAMKGLFSTKSDVFSYGVLILEIVSGKRNTGFHHSECGFNLLTYVWRLWCEGNAMMLMDPVLEDSFKSEEVLRIIHIGLLCVQKDAANRPNMPSVVLMLPSNTMTLPNPRQPVSHVG